jgi:hypothetical protein
MPHTCAITGGGRYIGEGRGCRCMMVIDVLKTA